MQSTLLDVVGGNQNIYLFSQPLSISQNDLE